MAINYENGKNKYKNFDKSQVLILELCCLTEKPHPTPNPDVQVISSYLARISARLCLSWPAG
jgi:hypothetical protein